MDYYLVFQEGQTEQIYFKLTNNDESTLTVNDIYLDLIEYQPDVNAVISSGDLEGNYSTPVFYGVQLGNVCQKYRCTLLDEEGVQYFFAYQELPPEANIKTMGEQIGYNETDEINIIFSTLYPGKYRFKIIIDYTIRNFNRSIESDELSFILLDSSSMP